MKTELTTTCVHALSLVQLGEHLDDGELHHNEDTANSLRAVSRRIADVSWKLDSIASMVRKAKAGYRSSPLTGDTAWEAEKYEEAYKIVLAEAETLLAKLEGVL